MCKSAKNVFVFYDQESPENAMRAALFQGDNVTHLRSIVKSVDPAVFLGDAIFARDCGPDIGHPRNRVL